MNNPIFLFVGKSASGKTTIAEMLESKHGYKTLQSYTTRPKRYDDETGHIFISDDEFDKLPDIIAYTEYNGHRYCATKDLLDKADIYVVDVPGVETLLKRYKSDRPICVIYFDASVPTRIDRMITRHDCDAAIISRLYNDEQSDWEKDVEYLTWHYRNNFDRDVQMYLVNANSNLDTVFNVVSRYIDGELGGNTNDYCM